MKKIALAVLMVFPLLAPAQKAPVKYGEVSMDELKMTRYEKDTSAAAVVLFDYGESSLDYVQGEGFSLNFERTTRIKILKKDGYQWADFSIPLYYHETDDEKLVNLKGVTYNLVNGKAAESKLKPEAIFREQTGSHRVTVKFALPNVKEGSVIEIFYKTSSPFLFSFQEWDFQTTIPIQWSEYRTHIPEYFQYKQQWRGYLPMTTRETQSLLRSITLRYKERGTSTMSRMTTSQTSSFETETVEYKENYSRWVLRDVPAFREEHATTTYRNYVSHVDFELNSYHFPNAPGKTYNNTWEQLSAEYLSQGSFGGVISGSAFLKDLTEQVVTGKSTTREKVAGIYSFVKSSMIWDGRYRSYTDQNLKKVYDDKKGSSAQLNLMLLSMFHKAGIKAYPLLISTRDNGLVRKESPIETQFNSVIAVVEMDEKYVFLDATDRALPMALLPEQYLNGEGLLLKEQPEWLRIDPIKSRTMIDSDLSLTPEGGILGRIQFTNDGYAAREMRIDFVGRGKEDYLKDFAARHGWEIRSAEILNIEKISEAVVEKYEIRIDDYAQVTGEQMYVNPLLATRLTQNPFKADTREYPVDFGSLSDSLYVARITLPEGWEVEELPKPRILTLPGNSARCIYNVSQNGRILLVTSQVAVNRAVFTKEEYPLLREFYDWALAKHAEQIVLKKSK